MKTVLTVALIAASLATTSAAAPRHYGTPGTWFSKDAPAADKLRILRVRADHAHDVLRFFSNHPKPAATAKGRAVTWQHKRLLRWATVRIRQVKRELWRTLPDVNDWKTATIIAQRPYPGTQDWMLSISDREGGWSNWVWYGGAGWSGHHIGGDTVGGWMQFRYSTFAPYWRGATKDLRRRGFIVPDLGDGYQPWLEPLGQALTAGYMRYYGKDGCHWCL